MKKHSLSALLMLLLAFPAFAQQHTRAVTFDFSRDKDGNIVVESNNQDYCDYFGFIDFTNLIGYTERGGSSGSLAIPPGKKKLMTLVRDPSAPQSSYRYTTSTYRGSLMKKIDPQFVYSLPVKAGDSIQFIPAKSSEFTSLFNLQHAGDTIYACREGRVCDDKLTDTAKRTVSSKNKLIIYHKDGSLAEYTLFSEPLVYPKDYVDMGQPIAIVKPDENNRKRVAFSLYFLDKNKVRNANSGIKHSTIVPVFHSANKGDGKLEERTTYVANVTDEMTMQDMSKKERDKYLKKKEKEK